ncbi:proton-coupled amino acid transporter 1-like [Dysidea avara]|uniref:proton-coupled amino acid transporter 1-like n=1 Tax=Dysidea avara TaxID=196820 RepID=UPI0033229F44
MITRPVGLLKPTIDCLRIIRKKVYNMDQHEEKDPLLSRHVEVDKRLQVSHDSGDIDDDNLKMHTYANLSHSDVGKVDKRAMHPVTSFEALVHLVKGNLGTGLLALPYAVSKVGYVLGPAMLVVMGLVASHCMILLTRCSQALCKRHNTSTLDYGEVAEAAVWDFKFEKRIGSYTVTEIFTGKIAKTVVNIVLIMTQFGFCCVYFVFMGDNIREVAKACGFELDSRFWILILLPLVVVFSWIRNLDALAPLATVANICILFGLGAIMYDIFHLIGEKKAAVYEPSGVKMVEVAGTALPVFFGNAIYAFEGIGVVLPLENKAKNPIHFPKVVYLGMGVITSLYTVFGALGYLAFGDDIDASITLNLPGDKHLHSVVYHIVKLYFSYAIFVTLLVQFYVPMDFLEPPLIRRLGVKHEIIKLSVFRTIIITITAGLAIVIPKLDLFISLVGAFASSALAIIFPPILQILVFCRTNEPFWVKMLWVSKSLLIVVVGVAGFATGTYVALKEIVDYLKSQ